MKTLVAGILGLTLVALACPASAYVIEVTTSIAAASAADDAQLKAALESAIDDVLQHAVAFSPTVLVVQNARLAGDRIYILVLIADGDGEETIKRLSAEEPVLRP